MKEDKKRGILSEELRRAHRKAGYLSDLRFANGISAELRQKRYTVDSGYSTSDGMDKRWSQEIGKVRDESCITDSYYLLNVHIYTSIFSMLFNALIGKGRGMLNLLL